MKNISVALIRRLATMLICAMAAAVCGGTRTLAVVQSIGFKVSSEYVYGDRLAFRLESVDPRPIAEARLVVEKQNAGVVYSEIQPAISGSDIFLAVVSVQSLTLGPFGHLNYHWGVTYADGEVANSEILSLIYEDTSVPWTWTATRQNNIVAHSDGRDPSLDAYTISAANDGLGRSLQLLGSVDLPVEIDIYVYPDLGSMAAGLRLHRERVQDWVAAYALPDQAIVVASYSNSPDGLSRLQGDIRHEISHLITYNMSGQGTQDLPGWLNEGIALNISGDETLTTVLDQGIDRGVLLSMETLCVPRFNSLPPHDAALAYAQSENFVAYLVKRYGASQVRALVAVYRDQRSCDEGVQLALGVPLSDLENQWHADVSTKMTPATTDSGDMLPWVLAWVASVGVAGFFIMPTARRKPSLSDNATVRSTDLPSSSGKSS